MRRAEKQDSVSDETRGEGGGEVASDCRTTMRAGAASRSTLDVRALLRVHRTAEQRSIIARSLVASPFSSPHGRRRARRTASATCRPTSQNRGSARAAAARSARRSARSGSSGRARATFPSSPRQARGAPAARRPPRRSSRRRRARGGASAAAHWLMRAVPHKAVSARALDGVGQDRWERGGGTCSLLDDKRHS